MTSSKTVIDEAATELSFAHVEKDIEQIKIDELQKELQAPVLILSLTSHVHNFLHFSILL